MTFLKKNIILISILIIAIFLRFNYDFLIDGYIFDELAMAGIAKSKGLFEILKNSALLDYHAPLYYILIHPLTYLENEWIHIRILNLFFSIINIFIFYRIGSILKDKKTGYILASLLCVNHLHISITAFIKFYCLNFLIFSTIIYFLIKIIKDKKNYTKLGISNALFSFSSTFGIVFVVLEYIILFFIQKKEKKQLLKSFLISLSGFFLYSPILVYQTKTALNNIISPHSAYPSFSIFGLWSILNDYFSPLINYSATHDTIEGNTLILKWLKTILENAQIDWISFFGFIIFSFLPIIICTILLIKNLKNNISKYLFLISFLYLLFFITLTLFEIAGLIPLYVFCFGLTILVLSGLGLSEIKNNKLKYILFSYLITINLIIPNSYPIDKRDYDKSKIYLCPIKYIKKIDNNQIILTTLGGRFLKEYFNQKNIYSFDNEQMSASHNKKLINLIYNENEIKNANKKNAKDIFFNQIRSNYKNPKFEKYVFDSIISKMEKGDKLTFIMYSDDCSFIASKKDMREILNKKDYNWHLTNSSFLYQLKNSDNDNYTTEQLADLIQSYSYKQLILILDKYLTRTNIEQYKKILNNKWEKTFESTNFNKDTLWIAQNVLMGWIFVTYEKL